jgi:O-antigen/teichoic acid export membrane protein
MFTVALSLQAMVYMPLGVFEQAAIPAWTRMAAHEPPAVLAASYRQVATVGFAAAAGLGLVVLANDRTILTLLFGPPFAAAEQAVTGAVLATLFGALTGPNEGMLRALGSAAAIFRARTAAAVAGVLAGLLLIPGYGLGGAIAAFAFTTVAINATYGVQLYLAGGIHPFTVRHTMAASLTAAGSTFAIASTGSYADPWWIAAHLCAAVLLAANTDVRSALRSILAR